MRVGVVLPACETFPGLVQAAADAEDAGVDFLCVREERPGNPDALAAAAALSGVTRDTRVLALVDPQAGLHPLHLAEKAAVADLALGGRLILGLQTSWGDEREAELLAILFAAHAARPFRHEGVHWRVPANLESNFGHDTRISATPWPAQFDLPTWVFGARRSGLARRFGIPFIADHSDGNESVVEAWANVVAGLGEASLKLSRPGFVRLAGTTSAAAHDLVTELREARRMWGLDAAIVTCDSDDWRVSVELLTRDVRSRLRLDTLPAEVEALWQTS